MKAAGIDTVEESTESGSLMTESIEAEKLRELLADYAKSKELPDVARMVEYLWQLAATERLKEW